MRLVEGKRKTVDEKEMMSTRYLQRIWGCFFGKFDFQAEILDESFLLGDLL
jgi:hypothetical protein